MYEKYLEINPEVEKALEYGRPVVALESTIISHGMPYPKNVETALAVEQIVRDNGATPATIAIIKGKLKVGLTREEIEYLGSSHDVIKASRRDIPFILAKGLDGATTIGGVHRGAQTTLDISADLQELAHTNVTVVCAGAKSILDIGLTLEYLETQGVPVVGFGTSELPAFYTSKSGFAVDYQVDTASEMAAAMKAKWDLGLNGGIVVANPIPADYEMDPAVINGAIEQAVREAEEQGIKGKDSTPFLLARVKELTGGASLESNIQLVFNNVKVGAQIAVEYSKV